MKRKIVFMLVFICIWLTSLGGCDDDYGNNESGIERGDTSAGINLYEDPPTWTEIENTD